MMSTTRAHTGAMRY